MRILLWHVHGAWTTAFVHGRHDYVVPLGKAAVARPGRHVTVISYALMLQRSLEAAEKLAPEGIDVEVVDLRTLFPYDKETILESVRKTSRNCGINASAESARRAKSAKRGSVARSSRPTAAHRRLYCGSLTSVTIIQPSVAW